MKPGGALAFKPGSFVVCTSAPTLVRRLFEVEEGVGILREQVADVLVVELEEAGAHEEVLVLRVGMCNRGL